MQYTVKLQNLKSCLAERGQLVLFQGGLIYRVWSDPSLPVWRSSVTQRQAAGSHTPGHPDSCHHYLGTGHRGLSWDSHSTEDGGLKLVLTLHIGHRGLTWEPILCAEQRVNIGTHTPHWIQRVTMGTRTTHMATQGWHHTLRMTQRVNKIN